MLKTPHNKGASTIEYATVIMFIIAALLITQKYILRSFMGRWKTAGDSFGHGRQYDPRPFGVNGEEGGTLECYWNTTTNSWLSVTGEAYYDGLCQK